MGCDIHPNVIVYDEHLKWWSHFAHFHFDRDYLLFATLAGVRNGYGVEGFIPPRGIYANVHGLYDEDLGDHSYSWLTSQEFKKALILYNRHVPSFYTEKYNRDADIVLHLMEYIESPDNPLGPRKALFVFGFDS